MPVAARRRERHGVVLTLRTRHPAVLLGAREDARSITLDRLVVPSGRRGRGLGSALMRDLVAYADQHHKQVRLTPSGAFGGKPRRLAAFYARFGFVPNAGAQRDPACGESMYRNPARSGGQVERDRVGEQAPAQGQHGAAGVMVGRFQPPAGDVAIGSRSPYARGCSALHHRTPPIWLCASGPAPHQSPPPQ